MNVKKMVALTTSLCFLYSFIFAPALQAAADLRAGARDAKELLAGAVLPPTIGRVTEAKDFGTKKIVINIQDLHCHAEVERNIGRILGHFDRRFGLERVYVEGAVAGVDTSWLAGIKDARLRDRLLGSLIDEGKLTGAEYYSIVAGKPRLLYGLEDKNVYVPNLVRLGLIMEKRDAARATLADLRQTVHRLTATYCSSRNRKLDDLITRNRDGKVPSEKYFALLKKYGENCGIDMGRYTAIDTMMGIAETNRTVDYSAVGREFPELLTTLKQSVPYGIYRSLQQETGDFARFDELLVRLPDIARAYHIDLDGSFPHTGRLLKSVRASQSSNPLKLLSEEKRLIAELHAKLAANVPEREVLFVSDFFGYLENYADAEIAADDYRYFTDNLSAFRFLWAKYTLSDKLASLDPYFAMLDEYYRVNVERNTLFLKNISEDLAAGDVAAQGSCPVLADIDKMLAKADAGDVIVTVTGGFHSAGLAQLLAEKKISYLVVTPNVTQATAAADTAYASIIKQQAKILASSLQQLSLCQNPSFIKIQTVIGALLNQNIGSAGVNILDVEKQAQDVLGQTGSLTVTQSDNGIYNVRVGRGDDVVDLAYVLRDGKVTADEGASAAFADKPAFNESSVLFEEVAAALTGIVYLEKTIQIEGKTADGSGPASCIKKAALCVVLALCMTVASGLSLANRQPAFAAVSQAYDTQVIERQIALLNDDDISARDRAGKLLIAYGPQSVSPLINALTDGSRYIRGGSARLLGQIGHQSAQEPLIRLLQDGDIYVRSCAAKALGNLHSSAAAPALIASLGEERNAAIRETAIVPALVRIGATAQEPVAAATQSGNPEVRRCADLALRQIVSAKTTVATEVTSRDQSAPAQTTVPEKTNTSSDNKRSVTERVLQILSYGLFGYMLVSGIRAWWMVRRFKSVDPSLDIPFVVVFNAVADRRGQTFYLSQLYESKNTGTRRIAVTEAARRGGKGASLLFSALNDDDAALRDLAASFLIKGDQEQRQELMRLINSRKYWQERMLVETVDLLGNMRNLPESLPFLIEKIENEYSSVRNAAQNALEKCGALAPELMIRKQFTDIAYASRPSVDAMIENLKKEGLPAAIARRAVAGGNSPIVTIGALKVLHRLDALDAEDLPLLARLLKEDYTARIEAIILLHGQLPAAAIDARLCSAIVRENPPLWVLVTIKQRNPALIDNRSFNKLFKSLESTLAAQPGDDQYYLIRDLTDDIDAYLLKAGATPFDPEVEEIAGLIDIVHDNIGICLRCLGNAGLRVRDVESLKKTLPFNGPLTRIIRAMGDKTANGGYADVTAAVTAAGQFNQLYRLILQVAERKQRAAPAQISGIFDILQEYLQQGTLKKWDAKDWASFTRNVQEYFDAGFSMITLKLFDLFVRHKSDVRYLGKLKADIDAAVRDIGWGAFFGLDGNFRDAYGFSENEEMAFISRFGEVNKHSLDDYRVYYEDVKAALAEKEARSWQAELPAALRTLYTLRGIRRHVVYQPGDDNGYHDLDTFLARLASYAGHPAGDMYTVLLTGANDSLAVKSALINFVLRSDGRKTGYSRDYFATVPETSAERREWLSRWYTLIADTLKADDRQAVQDMIIAGLQKEGKDINALEAELDFLGFRWIDLTWEGKWPQSDGMLGKLVANKNENGLQMYFLNKWLPSMKYEQLRDTALFTHWVENSFVVTRTNGFFSSRDLSIVKRALYFARVDYLGKASAVESLREKQVAGKLRENAFKLFDDDIAESKYHLDHFKEIGGSVAEDFYVGLFDDLLHLSGEFMLSGVCTNYDRSRQVREGEKEGYHFATIALKDAAGRVYGYTQVQVLKIPLEGAVNKDSGEYRVLALTGINISEKELPMERRRAVLAILECARSLAAQCGLQAVIPSNASIHSNQSSVRGIIADLAREGRLKTADLATRVVLSKRIPGKSATYDYSYKAVYVIGALPDLQLTAVAQKEPAGDDTASALASDKTTNISLLNRVGMAGFATAVGGAVGTLLFATPVGWLAGAVISGHYIRQAYYIARAGLERGPTAATAPAKLWFVIARLFTDDFVPARVTNGGVDYNNELIWRIPPWLREEIRTHEYNHLMFQKKHSVLTRIPLLEEIIVSLKELTPKTSLAGVVSAFRSFKLPRMLKYALLMPVLMAGGSGGYLQSTPADGTVTTTVWSEHARELAGETETILAELRACLEPGRTPKFNDGIYPFLEKYSAVVAQHGDYPVEAAWPVLKAVVQLDKPAEQELVRLIKEHYRDRERPALIDAILLMNNEVVGNWLHEQGDALTGRKIYYVSAETTHWAGGLGPVMTFHGKGMKELGADVEYIEPCYQLRRDKGNPEGDPLYYGDLGVTDIREVAEYDVTVAGKQVRVKAVHGINKDGVGTYLVRDVQEDGSSYYTRMLYNYGKSYNPASWEDFTSFFCVASAELIRRLETERKAQLGDAWKPAVVHTNDGQTAPLAAIAKSKYENDPVMEKIVYAFTTHTYKNRGVAGRAQGIHVLETMMGITKQYLPAFMRYDIADYTSGGIRLSNWSGAVSRQHRDDVSYIDPTAHSIGVTNGAVPEMMASLFREKLTEKYPGADVERPTPEQVQDTKKRCKELLNEMQVRTANGGVVQVDTDRILISYCRRLVREKAGRDRAFTDDNIIALVRQGANVVLFGNHQGTNESEWLASGLRELENRIGRMKAERPDEYPGMFTFVQAFTAEQKMAILAATDVQVQDSDRTTGAAEFSEEDITANGGLEFSPPYSEGVIMAQGLPLAFERPGSGNTIVPENASPASYLEAFTKAIRLYNEDKAGFYRNCAASVRINRIQRYLLTSAVYLREYNRVLSRIEKENAEDRQLVKAVAAEAGKNPALAGQLLDSGRNGVSEFCFHDMENGGTPSFADGKGVRSFLSKKDAVEKACGYEAILHHLEAGDYERYVETLFDGLGCSAAVAKWFERLNNSPGTIIEKDARLTNLLRAVVRELDAPARSAGAGSQVSGSWSANPLYARYAAWWLETLVSFGAGTCVLLAFTHIPFLQSFVAAPAVAAAVAALTFWLPHVKYRGIDYALKKNILAFAAVTFTAGLGAFLMGATPVSYAVVAACAAAHLWMNRRIAGAESNAGIVVTVPLSLIKQKIGSFAPRNLLSGQVARGLARPLHTDEFLHAYPHLAGKTFVTMSLALTPADIADALALARTGEVNALLVARAMPEIPVQQDDGTIVLMDYDTAFQYAAERGAAMDMFNVPVMAGEGTPDVAMRVRALRYTAGGNAAVVLFVEPLSGFERYPALGGDAAGLGATELTLLRRAFLETVARVQDDVQREQPKLFSLGLPVRDIAPVVMEMKGMAALLAPGAVNDGYNGRFGNMVTSFVPDNKNNAFRLDRLEPVFDVHSAGAESASPKKSLHGWTDAPALEAKLSVYEPAVVVKNAESAIGAQSAVISKVTSITKLLPSPYDASSPVGKIPYLAARARDLKDSGVTGMLISPFDPANPVALDVTVIDESMPVTAYPALQAARPRAAGGEYVDIAALSPRIAAFWQHCHAVAAQDRHLAARLARFAADNPRLAARARSARPDGLSPEAFMLAQMYGFDQLDDFIAFAAGGEMGTKVYGAFTCSDDDDPAMVSEAIVTWMGRRTAGNKPALQGFALDLSGLRDIPEWLPALLRDVRAVNPDAAAFITASREFDHRRFKELCDAMAVTVIDQRIASGEESSPYYLSGDNVSVEIIPQGGLLSARDGAELKRLVDNLQKKCARASSIIVPDDLLADAHASADPYRRYMLPSEKTADMSATRAILNALGIARPRTPGERGMATAFNLDDAAIPSLEDLPAGALRGLLGDNAAGDPGYIDTVVETVGGIPALSQKRWAPGWQKIGKLQRWSHADPEKTADCARELSGFMYGIWQRMLLKHFMLQNRPFVNTCDGLAFNELLARAGIAAEENGHRLADIGSIDDIVRILLPSAAPVDVPSNRDALKAELLRDPGSITGRPELIARYAGLLASSGQGAPDARQLLNRCIDVLRTSGSRDISPVAVAGMIMLFDIAADRQERMPTLQEFRDTVKSANTVAIKALNSAG